MSTAARRILIIAAVSLAVATGLGAYASHGLDSVLDARTLRSVLIAIDYQFYHSLGLLALGLLSNRHPERAWSISAALMVAGVLLFCGSIYLGAFGIGGLGGAAPVGGICFIGGWLVLAYGAFRNRTAVIG